MYFHSQLQWERISGIGTARNRREFCHSATATELSHDLITCFASPEALAPEQGGALLRLLRWLTSLQILKSFVCPSGGGFTPQPRVSRQGASFQHAYISPKYPHLPDLECLVIVYYKCSTGSTTWPCLFDAPFCLLLAPTLPLRGSSLV